MEEKNIDNIESFRQILSKLPQSVKDELELLPQSIISEIEEIRMRCGQHVRIQGQCCEKIVSHIITPEDLIKTLNSLIKFSYYAYEEDLAKGFITIEGGHRVGICGKAVVKKGQNTLIKEISSMNIRFCKEIKGCSEHLANYLLDIQGKPSDTLIVSPPGCGKTTLLRDITRLLSYKGIKTAVCDERSEIAGMFNSVSSFDLGPRTDILDGAPKAQGIEMLIRSMSPQVIITDEIGKKEDIEAIRQCMTTGVSVITSIHGNNQEDLVRSAAGPLIESDFFKNIIYLSKEKGPGTIKEVIHV